MKRFTFKGLNIFKKGATPQSAVVGIIILLVSAGILFLFFSQLNFESIANDEVCHQSVVLRASTPDIGNARNIVPLKCKTEKICLGKECEDFAGAKGITTIPVENTGEIERVISRELVACWEMMGQGKLGLFSSYYKKTFGVSFKADEEPASCVICSRIAFDEANLKKEKIDLEKLDVFSYLLTHKFLNSDKSYYEKLVGESPISPDIDLDSKTFEGKFEKVEETNEKIKNSEIAILFAQVSAPDGSDVFENTALAAAGLGAGSFVLAPVATSRLIAPILANPVASFVGLTVGVIGQQASVAYHQNVAAGYCGDVAIESEARKGCSVVRVINYDAEDIGKYCTKVESIS